MPRLEQPPPQSHLAQETRDVEDEKPSGSVQKLNTAHRPYIM